MSLKKSKGNMYDWVTHMHSHLGGECPHRCKYCYVQRNRFGVSPRYKGVLRFFINELEVDYGEGKTIFIEHMNDMFAENMNEYDIQRILSHCRKYQKNHYVFQTKNPERAYKFITLFPIHYMIGTTIESDIEYKNISEAPKPIDRYKGLRVFPSKTFVTIEPILDFNVDILAYWLKVIQPEFVNIGADSKRCGLPEPSKEKLQQLINTLNKNHIVIKKKTNLKRLLA